MEAVYTRKPYDNIARNDRLSAKKSCLFLFNRAMQIKSVPRSSFDQRSVHTAVEKKKKRESVQADVCMRRPQGIPTLIYLGKLITFAGIDIRIATPLFWILLGLSILRFFFTRGFKRRSEYLSIYSDSKLLSFARPSSLSYIALLYLNEFVVRFVRKKTGCFRKNKVQNCLMRKKDRCS